MRNAFLVDGADRREQAVRRIIDGRGTEVDEQLAGDRPRDRAADRAAARGQIHLEEHAAISGDVEQPAWRDDAPVGGDPAHQYLVPDHARRIGHVDDRLEVAGEPFVAQHVDEPARLAELHELPQALHVRDVRRGERIRSRLVQAAGVLRLHLRQQPGQWQEHVCRTLVAQRDDQAPGVGVFERAARLAKVVGHLHARMTHGKPEVQYAGPIWHGGQGLASCAGQSSFLRML